MSHWGIFICSSTIFFLSSLFGKKSFLPLRTVIEDQIKEVSLLNIDPRFMAMFMGIVDGDGYIYVGPNKVKGKRSTIITRLIIELNLRDKQNVITN